MNANLVGWVWDRMSFIRVVESGQPFAYAPKIQTDSPIIAWATGWGVLRNLDGWIGWLAWRLIVTIRVYISIQTYHFNGG